MEEDVINNSESLTDLEISLWKTLERIRDEYNLLETQLKTQKWITRRIQELFGDIGFVNDYDVASSFHGCGWLYDLVWFVNNEDGYLTKVPLVLESEMSDRKYNALKYDFEKLLLANAELKIMICFGQGNFNYPANVNELINSFESSVKAFTHLSLPSRILILIWEDYMTGDIYPHLIINS